MSKNKKLRTREENYKEIKVAKANYKHALQNKEIYSHGRDNLIRQIVKTKKPKLNLKITVGEL